MLASLADLGLKPRPQTTPAFVRRAVNELYRYEIRKLRARYVRREFPKDEYIPRVIDLRNKYWVLSVPVPWLPATEGE